MDVCARRVAFAGARKGSDVRVELACDQTWPQSAHMPVELSKQTTTRGSPKGKCIPRHLQEHGEIMFQKPRFWANRARQVCLGGFFALMSVGLGPPGHTWRRTLSDNSRSSGKTNRKASLGSRGGWYLGWSLRCSSVVSPLFLRCIAVFALQKML